MLGLPIASAKSWGLNRAIYYAAAKRGFKGSGGPAKPEKHQRSFGEFWLGIDKAYKVRSGGRTLFTIDHFYQQVYRPRRDELAAKWNERATGETKSASSKS